MSYPSPSHTCISVFTHIEKKNAINIYTYIQKWRYAVDRNVDESAFCMEYIQYCCIISCTLIHTKEEWRWISQAVIQYVRSQPTFSCPKQRSKLEVQQGGTELLVSTGTAMWESGWWEPTQALWGVVFPLHIGDLWMISPLVVRLECLCLFPSFTMLLFLPLFTSVRPYVT